MSRFIQAEQGLNHTVIYLDESGRLFRYSGGTWSWRNNNPGNVKPGSVSHENNQIGTAGKFAVFPDYETGYNAMRYCLIRLYRNKSIDDLVSKYAPPQENNVILYRKFLHKQTGVTDDKKIKDFTGDEFLRLCDAIIKYEGYKPGTITEVHKVTKVKKNHEGIYELHLNDLGWMPIEDCITLTRIGSLNLAISHSRSGKEYLKARPGDPFQEDLFTLHLKETTHENT